jgi:diaminopimelate epimerase
MRFAKGHGTGNDFVILPDPDGRLALSARLVARICDRRTGLGADGVLRVVRSAAAGVPDAGRQAATWFMDYRNADGSVAEMCGNGIRVFARYLLEHDLAAGPEVPVATRAGLRLVRRAPGGEFSVDMGPATVLGSGSAVIGGRSCAGLVIDVGNPHLACLVAEPVAGWDLSAAPVLNDGRFPAGANVELVRITGQHRAEMRVYERGSGVTMSCGTGAVAAAVAAATEAGEWDGGGTSGGDGGPAAPWIVDVPGGRLAVTPGATASLLTGPAVLVAEGDLDDAWLAGQDAAAPSVA